MGRGMKGEDGVEDGGGALQLTSSVSLQEGPSLRGRQRQVQAAGGYCLSSHISTSQFPKIGANAEHSRRNNPRRKQRNRS